MKKQFKAIILALVFGTISANAQGSLSLVGENYSVNSTNEFSNFVNTKARKVSRKNNEDLKTYVQVVNLYHNSSVSFYNLDEAKKAEFIEASAILSSKLGGMRKSEAKAWAKNIELNQSIFEFIWSSKKAISTDNEIMEVPAVVENVTSL